PRGGAHERADAAWYFGPVPGPFRISGARRHRAPRERGASRSDLVPFCNAMIDLFEADAVRDLAPAPGRVRYVARLTHVGSLAGIATAVLVGRAALRSPRAKRLSIGGLLGGAAAVA